MENDSWARGIHCKRPTCPSPNLWELSLAKTLGVLSFTPLTMLQACAQAVDFKVGHHFGEGHPVGAPTASYLGSLPICKMDHTL
jgi:hypothetical protein